MIYSDFEICLVPEDMESKIRWSLILTNIKSMVACSYSYESVCVGNKFRKPFKSYLGEGAVYSFIFYSDVMKKHFNNFS